MHGAQQTEQTRSSLTLPDIPFFSLTRPRREKNYIGEKEIVYKSKWAVRDVHKTMGIEVRNCREPLNNQGSNKSCPHNFLQRMKLHTHNFRLRFTRYTCYSIRLSCVCCVSVRGLIVRLDTCREQYIQRRR